MTKILFLPFLQIPSGHQQTADALISKLQELDANIECKKVDLFSYTYGNLEKFISQLYLKWIGLFPKSYSHLYKKMVLTHFEDKQRYIMYEIFFEKQLEQLIMREKPTCVICTHALPSRIMSRLKVEGRVRIPVFNVYTDFFIHNGWGIQRIDGHFISTGNMKSLLLENSIPEEKIHFTGIPIHPSLKKKPIIPEPPRKKLNILISGGSMGAGKIEKLIANLSLHKHIQYYILCGRNTQLYQQIKMKKKYSHLTPLPYIQSRNMMDMIYNSIDIIVTKPGGVTISECLQKRIPIFIYHKLPGQEEMNHTELQAMQLVHETNHWTIPNGLSEEILHFSNSSTQISQYFHHLYQYEKEKHPHDPARLIIEQLS